MFKKKKNLFYIPMPTLCSLLIMREQWYLVTGQTQRVWFCYHSVPFPRIVKKLGEEIRVYSAAFIADDSTVVSHVLK